MICLLSTIEQCKASFEALDPSYDQKNIKIIGQKNKEKVYVIIVEDQLHKKKYCVKQYCEPDKIFLSLKEVLISLIAESANIPVNRVRLIPAETFFPGKTYKKRMATLHTFVPGESLQSIKYPEVDIQQFNKKGKVFGLTRNVINHMSLSPNLAKIVAFDTFTGSKNRSRVNVFFDEKSNDFYGIDLKKAFLKDLGHLTYESIKKMYAAKSFTSRQIDTLKIYCDTLKKLIAKNSPSDTCKKLDALVKTTNLNHKYVLLTRNSVEECKEMIFQNYNSTKKLVKLLDEIIKKHTKQKQ